MSRRLQPAVFGRESGRLPGLPAVAAALLLLLAETAVAQSAPCIIDTFAGGNDSGGEPILSFPERIDSGADGSLYIADRGLGRILKISPDSRETSTAYSGPVFDLASAPHGDLYVSTSNRVIRIPSEGEPFHVLGTVSLPACSPDKCEPGISAAQVRLRSITSIDSDSLGNLFAVGREDSSQRYLIKVDAGGAFERAWKVRGPSQVLVDLTGQVHLMYLDWLTLGEDNELHRDEELSTLARFPEALELGPGRQLYFTGLFTGRNAVARIAPGLIYDPIAGGIDEGLTGDGGSGPAARLDSIGGLLLTSDDTLYISDTGNARVRRIRNVSECPSGGPRPLAFGLANAASYGYASPGAVFSIFGVRLGPDDLVSATLDSENRLPTRLAGVRVLVDGTPAPLLFVSAGQIGGVVPYSSPVSGGFDEFGRPVQTAPFPRILVESSTGKSDEHEIVILPSDPGIFTLDASGSGPAAAINQDGSLNSAENPARAGEIVVFWATGFGAAMPTPADGQVLFDLLPEPLHPVEVRVSGRLAEVLYAAAAPGMVAGVMQINARVPTGIESQGVAQVAVKVGAGLPSRSASLFVAK